jgi:putative redox protein
MNRENQKNRLTIDGGLILQNIKIKNNSGEKLATIVFHPQAEMRLVVVVCHGFRGGKENGGRIFQFAHQLNHLGIAVLAFDFSGSGESEGDFAGMTLSKQAADLESVIDYTCKQFDVPVILLGRSFGGSTVIAGGAGDKRIAGFILWATPVFMAETFAAMMPAEYKLMQSGQIVSVCDDFGYYKLEPAFAVDLGNHNMDLYIQSIENRPVLIIQAQDDEIVSPENALYMQKRMKNVSLRMVAEAGHRFLDKTSLREDMTIEWLNVFLSGGMNEF